MGLLPDQSFMFTLNDWLTSDVYDANGNTTNSAGNVFRYNAENRLTNAIVGGTNITIVYDGDGNRVRKTVVAGTTTNTTWYLVDNRNLTGYAQVLEEHVSLNSQPATLNRVYNYGLDLISQRDVPSGTTLYFGYDGLGSTRLLTTTNGAVANVFAYDAYGTLIASNGSPQTVYLYCGEQFDPQLGFYYLRARYLNPGTGRFWTRDSFEGNPQDPLSLHKYLYAHADPVNGIDPSGKSFIGTFIGLGSTLVTFSMGISLQVPTLTHGALLYAETKFLLKPALRYRDFALNLIAMGDANGFAEYERATRWIDVASKIISLNHEVVDYFFIAKGAVKFMGARAAMVRVGTRTRTTVEYERLRQIEIVADDAVASITLSDRVTINVTTVKSPIFAKDFSKMVVDLVDWSTQVALKLEEYILRD